MNGIHAACRAEQILPDMMYEDELPAGISDQEYEDWFQASAIVDGVRMLISQLSARLDQAK